MTAEDIPALRNYSQQLIDHIRQREGDILKLLITLGGTLTLYSIAIDKSGAIDALRKSQELKQPSILISVTVLVQMIFAWVGCFILANAYNYRSLWCVFARIQDRLGMLKYKPDSWHPWIDGRKNKPRHESKWSTKIQRDKSPIHKILTFLLFDLVPEMQKVHILATVFFSLMLTMVTSVLLCKTAHCSLLAVPIWTFLCFLFLTYFLEGHYYCKLSGLKFSRDLPNSNSANTPNTVPPPTGEGPKKAAKSAKLGETWTPFIAIAALVLSLIVFWYTFLRPSTLLVSLPPSVHLNKMELTTLGVTKTLPSISASIAFTAFGPKSVMIEDLLIRVHHKNRKFDFVPVRESLNVLIPAESKPKEGTGQPETTLMKIVHLAPNSSSAIAYVFIPYDKQWDPYPCLGELRLVLYVRVRGTWIKKDEKVFDNISADWKTMKGFCTADYSERESSVRNLE